MKLFLGLFTVLLLTTQTSFAADKSSGCGLGKLGAPKDTLVSTTTASIVDYLVPVRIFATTSGTSGCAQHDLVMNKKMQEHFVNSNIDIIKFESAVGEGEYVNALARVMGCNNQGAELFLNKLQKEYSPVFKDEHSGKVLNNMKALINRDEQLKTACPLAV